MKSNEVISIIVPVYNVEEYIERCINSLLKQTYKNLEIILINDGSTDKTKDILNKYKDNKKLKIYNQKNSGAAKTRNKGINLATGKYIMFIDSDDYIEPDYVSNYYEAMIDDDYDLVVGGYQKIDNNGKVSFIRMLSNGEFAKYIVMGPVCKMYKRDFLIDNKIEFLDTKASEDVYFNAFAYSKNPKVKVIDDIGYYYCYNPESISNTTHKGFNKDVNILDLVSKINYDTIDNVDLNQYFIIRYLIWYLLYSGRSATSKQFLDEYKKEFEWLDINIKDYKNNKYIKHMPKGEIFKLYLCIKAFLIIHKLHLIKLFSKVYCRGSR